jgi:hypothetical protein
VEGKHLLDDLNLNVEEANDSGKSPSCSYDATSSSSSTILHLSPTATNTLTSNSKPVQPQQNQQPKPLKKRKYTTEDISQILPSQDVSTPTKHTKDIQENNNNSSVDMNNIAHMIDLKSLNDLQNMSIIFAATNPTGLITTALSNSNENSIASQTSAGGAILTPQTTATINSIPATTCIAFIENNNMKFRENQLASNKNA